MTESAKHLLSLQFSEADIAIIDRAASLCGLSRADFLREAALRAAEQQPSDQLPVHMSAEGFTDFTAILATPAEPVPEMVELSRRPAPWEVIRSLKA